MFQYNWMFYLSFKRHQLWLTVRVSYVLNLCVKPYRPFIILQFNNNANPGQNVLTFEYFSALSILSMKMCSQPYINTHKQSVHQ